ncbi:MAG: hypothetical protein IT305_30005 [Chloroflexi bacterium]|nr:hypothetical protein [Chloroflexota bacterium]
MPGWPGVINVPVSAPSPPSGGGGGERGQERPVWDTEFTRGLRHARSKSGRRRWIDAAGQIYEFDPSHGGELEVYDRRGRHIGVMNLNGNWIKPAVSGRRIEP